MSLRGPAPVPLAPLRRPMRAPVPVVRRALVPGQVAAVLALAWPGLMLRKFGSDQACADFFGRTRQTGSNWRSGHCKPDGPAVALAAMVWPEEFAALFQRGAQ